MQNLLLGSAIVYWYDDPIVHYELSEEWGKQKSDLYQVFSDSIRIYQVEINTTNTYDHKRHRYFYFWQYYRRIQELIVILVQGTLRLNAKISSDALIYDFETLEKLNQSERIRALKEAASQTVRSTEEADYVMALEDDNTLLTTDMITLRQKLKEEEEQRAYLELEKQDLEEQINTSRKEFAEVAKTQAHISDATTNLLEIRKHWGNLPRNMSDILDLASVLSPDKILILNEAKKSSKDTLFGNIYEAWSLLYAMATHLYDLYFEEQVGDIELEFKNRSGFELTLKEGSQTKSDAKLMALRQRQYENKSIDISAHTRIDKGGKNLRVHYYPDNDKRLLVIGHFGNHLPTAGTQRRGEK